MSPAETSQDRFHLLDPLRIIAAFGIVAFHFGPRALSTVSYVGLPAFLLVTFALVGRRGELQLSANAVKRRFKRLLLPWAAWWLIYLAVEVRTASRSGRAISFDHTWIFAGPSIHLWYLPFAFCGTLLGSVILAQSWATSSTGIRTLGAVGVLSLIVLCLATNGYQLWPLDEWWVGLPSVFLGLCIGLTLRRNAQHRVLELSLLVAACLVAGALSSLLGGRSQVGLAYAVGTLWVVASFLVSIPSPVPGAKALAELTLGVYLIHPILFALLSKVLGDNISFARTCLLFLCSLLAVAGLRRLPFGKLIT